MFGESGKKLTAVKHLYVIDVLWKGNASAMTIASKPTHRIARAQANRTSGVDVVVEEMDIL